MVVILAGPAVNLVLAFVILFGVYWADGGTATNNGGGAEHSSAPASRYLRPGDQIVAVDGKRNPSADQIATAIRSHRCPGKLTAGCQARTPVMVTVRRDGSQRSFTLYPVYDAQEGFMRLGFSFDTAPMAPGTAAGTSISKMWYVTHVTLTTVARLFEPQERKQLHSVVGTFKVTQQEFAFGTADALWTLALISLSLAVINLFPFLPLDGGHVFWAVAEKVRGRRIPFAVMERAGAVGFVLIICVFAIGLTNDISTLTGRASPPADPAGILAPWRRSRAR